jgi:hypothetical protein
MTFKVKSEKCATCIFRPGNPMSLEAGRVAQMVEECRQKDSFVICHDTIDHAAHERGVPGENEAACRGYLDTGAYPQMLRIAERLGVVEEVP